MIKISDRERIMLAKLVLISLGSHPGTTAEKLDAKPHEVGRLVKLGLAKSRQRYREDPRVYWASEAGIIFLLSGVREAAPAALHWRWC